MNIYIADEDLKRIQQLTTVGYPVSPATGKISIMYCPDCPFQYAPGVVGKSICPDCRHRLLVVSGKPEEFKEIP